MGQPCWLQLQQVTADGTALVKTPHELIREDAAWEGNVVEAPFLYYRQVSIALESGTCMPLVSYHGRWSIQNLKLEAQATEALRHAPEHLVHCLCPASPRARTPCSATITPHLSLR